MTKLPMCRKCSPPSELKETEIKGMYVCEQRHVLDLRPKPVRYTQCRSMRRVSE
jgi:hypothetical protein